jgi:hypothetical protein
MADPRWLRMLEELRASRFAALQGARVFASLPIAERLLNEIAATAIPADAPLRDVRLQPQGANRVRLTAKLARLDFLPAVTVTLEIEQQPDLPDSPLVLKVLSVPGLITRAGMAFSIGALLPPGIRLADQRLYVDIPVLLARCGAAELVRHLERLRVSTEEGRLIVDVSLQVRD